MYPKLFAKQLIGSKISMKWTSQVVCIHVYINSFQGAYMYRLIPRLAAALSGKPGNGAIYMMTIYN